MTRKQGRGASLSGLHCSPEVGSSMVVLEPVPVAISIKRPYSPFSFFFKVRRIMNRRDFLGAASAAGLVAATTYGQEKPRPPRVGLIGCGWYGKCDLLRLIQVAPVEVTALCDVDSRMLNDAAGIVAGRQRNRQRPRTFADYREMLRPRDLDIVLIATPDHWHALPMIAAVEAGADVWVQKPISVDIAEGKAMVAAARRARKAVQGGAQR